MSKRAIDLAQFDDDFRSEQPTSAATSKTCPTANTR